MAMFVCPRPSFRNDRDREAFIAGYVQRKQAVIACTGLFGAGAVTEVATIAGGGHHEVLSLHAVLENVFARLDRPSKKNMAETCKLWASFFLVGTETSKVLVDYRRQLVFENRNGLVMVSRGHTMVEVYCVCRAYHTAKEKVECHRRLRKYAMSDGPCFVLSASDDSGSDGYSDSDC